MPSVARLTDRLRPTHKYAAALVGVSLLSLGLASLVDDSVYSLLAKHAPSLIWISHARFTSLLVCIVIYFLTHTWVQRVTKPTHLRPRVALGIAVAWLCFATMFVFFTRKPGGIVTLQDWGDYASILATGLWGEELLFRGVIFELSEATWADSKSQSRWAIVISGLLASLTHLQYHGFKLEPNAVLQITLTLPGCLVYSVLRKYSGSIALPGIVHFLNNLVSTVLLV